MYQSIQLKATTVLSLTNSSNGLPSCRVFAVIIFALALDCFVLFASATTLPDGFSETTVASGIASPTAMAIAPDGRIFVSSQTGALRVIKDGVLLTKPFLTLAVDSTGERGLLGVAFDPHFNIDHFIYLYYTVPTTPAHNRVSRFTASGDVVVSGSETVLLDLDPLSSAANHNGGAVHFGADGKLYIAVGDNRQGAKAQNLGSLFGKILRINSDGTIPADNPFVQSPTDRHEIWAYGLRNPFTFAFRGTSSFMYINDVGERTWEEVDLGQAGANYGWPASEGPTNNPAYTPPVYYYDHGQGCAITGAAFYSPTNPKFPAFYNNKYFFGDYCSGFIRVLDPATNQATDFATGAKGPIDIRVAADGALYYLAHGTDSVMKILYTTGAAPPEITTQPASQLVSAGYAVTFSVVVSGATPYTYQWQRNDVDIVGATASSYKIAKTTVADNDTNFRVLVSNISGSTMSNEATLSVTPNKPPTAEIITPVAGTTYVAGTFLRYSGAASDVVDGNLPGSAFTWQVDFHHNTHIHPIKPPTTGSKSGAFVISTNNETSSNVYYIVTLRVQDSVGLTKTVVRNILPQKAKMTFVTQPAGLKISLDDQAPRLTPFTVTGVVGILRSIAAPSPQTLNGTGYIFQAWSDGRSKSHQISTPSVDTAYVANFAAQ